MWDGLDPRSHDARERDTAADPERTPDVRDAFTSGLDLPRGLERERVHVDGRDYDLRGSEARMLATVGAFRVVAIDDLRDDRGRPTERWHGDVEHLRSAGLIRVVAPLDRDGDRTTLIALTERGHQVLETHRTTGHETPQSFYHGVAKPRELSHDARLYRAYLKTAERLHAQGARVTRVVLDYELKRDYQRFLQDGNRERPDSDGRPTRTPDEVRQWAQEQGLPVLDGRVQFPDFRVEHEWQDGRREVEDVEVMTAHYRGAHAAAKARSGFTRFRAGGSRVGGRANRGGGGRSPDPRLAEEFLS
jgi:hypothetical protein